MYDQLQFLSQASSLKSTSNRIPSFGMLFILLLTTFIPFTAYSQVELSPWEFNVGKGVVTLPDGVKSRKGGERLALVYDYMLIPDKNDSKWKPAPVDNDGKIAYGSSSSSNIDKSNYNQFTQVDFTYFRAFLDVPVGSKVNKVAVTIGRVDDQAKMMLFNSKFPEGKHVTANDGKRGGNEVTTDFTKTLVIGEVNTFVVVQVDDNPGGNNLNGGITVKLNNKPVVPLTANKWKTNHATFTKQTDYSGPTDTDGDGLPDKWETTGYDYSGDGKIDITIKDLNAKRKDILIYYDWFEVRDDKGKVIRSHEPSAAAQKLVIDSFAKAPVSNPDNTKGITLHFRKGTAITDPDAEDIGLWDEFSKFKAANFHKKLWPIYHYVIFTRKYDSGNSSGISRNPSDFNAGASDFIVSLSHNSGDMKVAGTIMHELGHNLGLGHGSVTVNPAGKSSAEHTNRKPNHLSIMNYEYQFYGVQRSDEIAARIDYSRYDSTNLRSLDENALKEATSLAVSTKGDKPPYTDFKNYKTYYYCNKARKTLTDLTSKPDWNCDKKQDPKNVKENVNKDFSDKKEQNDKYSTLTVGNEWANLVYNGGALGALGAEKDLPMTVNKLLSDEPDIFDYIETHPNNVDESYTKVTSSMRKAFNQVVFASKRDGNFDIYVMDADGGKQTRITNSNSNDIRPVYSSDGSRIAFHTDRDGNSEIYSMNTDGSDTVNLSNNPASDSYPWYSTDGSKLVFNSNRNGNYEIYSMNVDGTGLQNLTNNSAKDRFPVISPDGSRIAFQTDRDGNVEIYVMNIDGSNPSNISNNQKNDREPSWSPDSSRIAFSTDRDGNYELYTMKSDGSDLFRLTNSSAFDNSPAWSSDGHYIFFVSGPEIARIDAGGTNLKTLTKDAGENSYPASFYLYVPGVTDEIFNTDDKSKTLAKNNFTADKPNICMIPFSKDNARAEVTVKLAKQNAKSENANLILTDEAFNSLQEQFEAFKKVTAQNCDAILLEPQRHSGVAAEFARLINETIKAKTPVVAILTDIEGAEFSSRVALDPRHIGDRLARSTCKRVSGKDTVFHVFPRYSREYVEEKEGAMLKEYNYQIQKLCPDVNIVPIEANHPRDVVPAVMKHLQAGQNPDLIITDHPLVISLLLEELTKRYGDKLNGIKFVGIGANKILVRALKKGQIEALIVGDHHHFSGQAMKAAVLATRGISLGKNISVPLVEMTVENIDKYKEFWAK